jgi:hypothetical protein
MYISVHFHLELMTIGPIKKAISNCCHNFLEALRICTMVISTLSIQIQYRTSTHCQLWITGNAWISKVGINGAIIYPMAISPLSATWCSCRNLHEHLVGMGYVVKNSRKQWQLKQQLPPALSTLEVGETEPWGSDRSCNHLVLYTCFPTYFMCSRLGVSSIDLPSG